MINKTNPFVYKNDWWNSFDTVSFLSTNQDFIKKCQVGTFWVLL